MARRTQKDMQQKGGFGWGTAFTLAAAAGAYFLYGAKDAQKNRKKVQGWMLKFKGDVLHYLEDMPDVNEKKYSALINKVAKEYKTVASSQELAAVSRELKGHWKHLKKHVGEAESVKEAQRGAQKTVRKATTRGKQAVRTVAKKTAQKVKKVTAQRSTKVSASRAKGTRTSPKK